MLMLTFLWPQINDRVCLHITPMTDLLGAMGEPALCGLTSNDVRHSARHLLKFSSCHLSNRVKFSHFWHISCRLLSFNLNYVYHYY